MERFLKYNPKSGFGYLTLAMLYAHAGRVQEARDIVAKFTNGWPEARKNVRFIMTLLPFKDLQVMERFAEGYIKAGLPGEPSGFYKVSTESRLIGEEIKELFFGRKVTGFDLGSGKQWWIEDNMLCDQWDTFYESLKDCWVVYRNPEGTPGQHDEFLGAPGYGIYRFSQIRIKEY